MTTSEAKQSLALKLKNARKMKRISVQKLAKLMSVPESTIEAMESQENMDLPLANLVGLANRYAAEVKLDPSEIASEIEVLRPGPQTKTKAKIKAPGSRIFVASRASMAVIAGIVLLVILSYAAWQAWQLTAAPKLSLESPSSDMVTDNPELQVTGKASPDSSVIVNGSNVSLGEDGSFTSTVYLQPGQNFLHVRALNALGHEAVEDRTIVFTPQEE